MPHQRQVAQILLRRHGTADRVPGRYRTQLGMRPAARQERLVSTHHLGHQLRKLLQAFEQEAPVAGSALRVRLEEEREREQDRGMGW